MNAKQGAVASILAFGVALAQQSTNFTNEEHVLNEGGHPHQGQSMASTNFTITLDAIGDALGRTGLSSSSFVIDGGFVAAYPPPGEVLGVMMPDKQTLEWNPERSVGTYNVYRDLISTLSALTYGTCLLRDLPSATASDTDTPPSGDGYFYLVTAVNRLDEEGTKGADSEGTPRPNPAPCS